MLILSVLFLDSDRCIVVWLLTDFYVAVLNVTIIVSNSLLSNWIEIYLLFFLYAVWYSHCVAANTWISVLNILEACSTSSSYGWFYMIYIIMLLFNNWSLHICIFKSVGNILLVSHLRLMNFSSLTSLSPQLGSLQSASCLPFAPRGQDPVLLPRYPTSPGHQHSF